MSTRDILHQVAQAVTVLFLALLIQDLHSPTSRVTAALAGAGLGLTAAIAFATFIKVFGIGPDRRPVVITGAPCHAEIGIAVAP